MMAQVEPEVHTLSFTELRRVSDFPGKSVQYSLDKFAELCVQEYKHEFGDLADHKKLQDAKAKTLPAILPGTLRGDAVDTTTKSIEAWTVLMVESDDGTVSVDAAADALKCVVGLIKTSTSHMPESPRWHALLPYSRPMTFEEHRRYKSLAFQYYEERLSLSAESANVRQVFFFGQLQGTHPVETSILDGHQHIDTLLDVLEDSGILEAKKTASTHARDDGAGEDGPAFANIQATELLNQIDPDLSYPKWIEALMAAKEAGVSLRAATAWCRQGNKFKSEQEVDGSGKAFVAKVETIKSALARFAGTPPSTPALTKRATMRPRQTIKSTSGATDSLWRTTNSSPSSSSSTTS